MSAVPVSFSGVHVQISKFHCSRNEDCGVAFICYTFTYMLSIICAREGRLDQELQPAVCHRGLVTSTNPKTAPKVQAVPQGPIGMQRGNQRLRFFVLSTC